MKRRKGIGPSRRISSASNLAGRRHGARVPALRRMDEHLHQVIVHAVVEVALEGPGELRMLDVARVDRGVVGVQAQAAILQLDHQLDGAVVLARGEIEQGMIVAAQFPPALFPEASRTYASVKSKHGVTAHRPGETQLRSRRIHLPHAGGGAGTAGARTGGAHAGHHRQGRGAHSRTAAARHAGERRVAIPLGGMGAGCWKACANCWRRFPIPTRRRPFACGSAACGRCCAEAAAASRSRARPARARGCSSGETSGICLMEVVGAAAPRLCRVLVPGARRPVHARTDRAGSGAAFAPAATSVRFSTLRDQIRTWGSLRWKLYVTR